MSDGRGETELHFWVISTQLHTDINTLRLTCPHTRHTHFDLLTPCTRLTYFDSLDLRSTKHTSTCLLAYTAHKTHQTNTPQLTYTVKMTASKLTTAFPHAQQPIIISAPMLGTSNGTLAAEVSKAGGIGESLVFPPNSSHLSSTI